MRLSKRIAAVALAAVMAVSMPTACGGGGGGSISIVADVVIKSGSVTANGGSGGTAGKRATAGADGEAGAITIKQLGVL